MSPFSFTNTRSRTLVMKLGPIVCASLNSNFYGKSWLLRLLFPVSSLICNEDSLIQNGQYTSSYYVC